jgi:hypothetical protein
MFAPDTKFSATKAYEAVLDWPIRYDAVAAYDALYANTPAGNEFEPVSIPSAVVCITKLLPLI